MKKTETPWDLVLDDDSEKIVSKSISFDLDSFIVIHSWNPLPIRNVPLVKTAQNLHYYCDSNAPPLFKLYSQFIFYDSI